MSREQALTAAGRSRPDAGRARPLAGPTGGLATAGGRPRRLARRHPYTRGPALAGVAVLLVLPALLLWSHQPALRQATAGSAAAVDPRLLIHPRTLTQTARVGGQMLTLTASPLVPGSNHFVVTLGDASRPSAGVQVRLVATMTEMAMRPLVFRARLVGPGRYEATGALSMFGRWQVIAQVSRPGAAPLAHSFGLSLDLPAGLQGATGSVGAGR